VERVRTHQPLVAKIAGAVDISTVVNPKVRRVERMLKVTRAEKIIKVTRVKRPIGVQKVVRVQNTRAKEKIAIGISTALPSKVARVGKVIVTQSTKDTLACQRVRWTNIG